MALDQAQPYAYYSGAGGVIAPTIFAPATTPRIVEAALRAQRELAAQVQTELVTAALVALGIAGGTVLVRGLFNRLERVLSRGPTTLAAQRAERGFLNLFRRNLSAGPKQGAITTEGVAVGGIEVSVQGGKLLARYTHITNVGRNKGFGRMAQQAFERAAVTAAKEAGATTAEVAVEMVQNPNWEIALKELGYSRRTIVVGASTVNVMWKRSRCDPKWCDRCTGAGAPAALRWEDVPARYLLARRAWCAAPPAHRETRPGDSSTFRPRDAGGYRPAARPGHPRVHGAAFRP